MNSVKEHTKNVHEKNSYKHECNQCEKSFNLKHALKRHINFVHKGLRLYKCQICKKSYGNTENLREHVRAIHDGIKPFACEKCQFRCSRKSRLRIHVANRHEGIRERKYNCNICDMAFYDMKGYQQHQKCKGHLEKKKKDTVTSEKDNQNYNCIFCKTTFKYQEDLKNHLHHKGCTAMSEKMFGKE